MEVAKLVSVYVKIRDKRAELQAAHDAQDAELKANLETIEQELLRLCKDNEVESLRTTAGTVTRVVRERVWAADWDAFKEFVRENDAVDLLEKRIHQGNFKEWAEANPGVVAPVNMDRKYAIVVRRS
jgi:hypothetical protein